MDGGTAATEDDNSATVGAWRTIGAQQRQSPECAQQSPEVSGNEPGASAIAVRPPRSHVHMHVTVFNRISRTMHRASAVRTAMLVDYVTLAGILYFRRSIQKQIRSTDSV